MLKIIKGNKKKVTSNGRGQILNCNCPKKAGCPMEGNCKVNEVVYKYDVIRPLSKSLSLTCRGRVKELFL